MNRGRLPACAGLVIVLMWLSPPVTAGHWSASIQTSSQSIDRVITRGDIWWSEVDDRKAGLGVGLAYHVTPDWRLGARYQRSRGFAVTNRCPDNGACPLILISESGRLQMFTVDMARQWEIGSNWSLGAGLGWMQWEFDTSGTLPGDSGGDPYLSAAVGRTLGNAWRAELGMEWSDIRYRATRLSFTRTLGR